MPVFSEYIIKVFLFIGLLLSPLMGQAYPLTVTTERGQLSLQRSPQTVAVFDLAALDNLDALGIDVAGVPKRLLPDYLAEYAEEPYTSVGSLFEPDYPVLERLQPDLILTGERSAGAYKPLSQLASVVDFSRRSEDLVGQLDRNLRLLGQIFNRQSLAGKKINLLKHSVDKTRKYFSHKKALVLFAYKGSLIPHAPGERFGMLYNLLGADSVVEPAKSLVSTLPAVGSDEARRLHEQRLTRALAEQPDWLIILDRGAIRSGVSDIDQTLRKHAEISVSQAWQAGQVFYLNAPDWYLATGGYQGVMETLEALQQKAVQLSDTGPEGKSDQLRGG